MRTIHKSSVIPIYGIAAVWILWAALLPMYRASDFLLLAGLSALAYLALSKLFPGQDIQEELPPEPTGDGQLDELLQQGRDAVKEYRSLIGEIKDPAVREKASQLGRLTEQIFADLGEHPASKAQVKRFTAYFLPAPLKLLRAYTKLEAQNINGENISGSMQRITEILDTTIEAYKKQIDAMFEGRALDIETDIEVLEAMMKREGLAGSDF